MKLNLNRSIVFFDLETTGLNISKDKIIEIALLKVNPDESEESYVQRFNPGMKIPEESTAIHGISDDDVKDMPLFKEKAKEIVEFIADSDLGGYNSNKFDVPFLLEELLNCEVPLDMSDRKSVDVQTIFHKMEQRTLAAAYQFYCDKELKNAHSAEADTTATYHILKAQLDKYEDVKNDIDFLQEFTRVGKNKVVDFVGRLAENENGELVYNFGKHSGKTIEEVYKAEPGYHRWMLDNDFPLITKNILREATDKLIAADREKREKRKEQDAAKMEDKLKKLQNKFKQ